MSKITKQELLTMVRNIENWMSDIKIEVFNQPNVTLPKSTRYDVEVGSRLDSLEARMDIVEGMFKTEPEPQPENQSIMPKEYGGILNCEQSEQTERKIVFDYLIGESGTEYKTKLSPSDFYEVIEMYKIGENKYLFGAKDKSWYYPYIYIGHYE